MHARLLSRFLIAASVLAAGCSVRITDLSEEAAAPVATSAEIDDAEPVETVPQPEPTAPPEPPATFDVDEVLTELQEGGFCDPVDVEDEGEVTAMHFVVNGEVQSPCFGEGDSRLDAAWQSLAEITPIELLDDISLLAGYESCDSCDTLAFVTSLDEQSSFFLVAIDVVAGDADPDELALTMQHELTHVFAQDPVTQIDVTIDADSCDTYYNGIGCFREGSYMWEWIQTFWDAEALATIPADGGINAEAGEERCNIDPAFTGAYGASNPEEDFAEVFSAYVFAVDVGDGLDEKLAFFDQFPELRQVRTNAEAAGRWQGTYSFEGCA